MVKVLGTVELTQPRINLKTLNLLQPAKQVRKSSRTHQTPGLRLLPINSLTLRIRQLKLNKSISSTGSMWKRASSGSVMKWLSPSPKWPKTRTRIFKKRRQSWNTAKLTLRNSWMQYSIGSERTKMSSTSCLMRWLSSKLIGLNTRRRRPRSWRLLVAKYTTCSWQWEASKHLLTTSRRSSKRRESRSRAPKMVSSLLSMRCKRIRLHHTPVSTECSKTYRRSILT